MNILKGFKKQTNNKQKKQVIVDTALYNRVKGKMVSNGLTFSFWLDAKMREEIAKEPGNS